MKIIYYILLCFSLLFFIGCSSRNESNEADNNIIVEDNSGTEDKVNDLDTKQYEQNNKTNKLNPFDLVEEKLSDKNVNLEGWNCKTQMIDLKSCRLLLSSNFNKSEESFSFIGYVYEKKTNIPDAIFVDNSVQITNASIYAVGLASNKEGQEKPTPSPSMAKYKYVQTSDTEAMITDANNKPLGEVESEDAKIINDRITKCKSIFSNK